MSTPQADRGYAISTASWTLLIVGGLTTLRLIGLFTTKIQLYPEEAQYWVWSRHLAFGYFSKPPMIAWLIRGTTALGGDGEPWVRLSAPLAHGVAALALQRAGARLYRPSVGLAAAVIYSLMPGVQLSSGAIATDAPMLMFVSLALWGYVGFVTADRRRAALRCGAGTGLALGLGCLAKYAAAYVLIGLLVHALVDPEARRRWRAAEAAVFAAALLLVLAPNLVWNLKHGFETFAHTAADADFSPAKPLIRVKRSSSFDPRQAPGFVASQFGVFGPIPFAVLIIGALGLVRRRFMPADDCLLLALGAPPLAVITVVAVIARANANWAAAAYCPTAVLVAAWLIRWRAWGWLWAAVGSQLLLMAVIFTAAISPAFADRAGLANSLKRARGWRETTELVAQQLHTAEKDGPVTALAVDDRFLFNALAYYGRSSLHRPGDPRLMMWVREARPHNEAESAAPLVTPQGGRVLFISVRADYRAEAMRDFVSVQPVTDATIALDPRHARNVFMFVGRGYIRRPRSRSTGLPIPL